MQTTCYLPPYTDDGEEDMAAKLSGLVQTALVVPTSSSCSPQTTLESQPQVLATASLSTPVSTQLSPHLTSQLTSTITNCSKNQSIVVTTLEVSFHSCIYYSSFFSPINPYSFVLLFCYI